jgi:hypothetical protein
MRAKLLLRFEEDLKEDLREIAKKEKRSLTSQIIKILSDYCEKRKQGVSKNGR